MATLAEVRKLDRLSSDRERLSDQLAEIALSEAQLKQSIKQALALAAEHRECGVPKFDGCFSHLPLPHCRADGYPWPCDVQRMREVLT